MEKELNIAALLKDKPVGTKLWSPIFGDCKCSRLLDSGIRVFPIHNGFTSTEEKSFFKTGQYTLAGEVCLFPSKQMQDWSKFAWKEGDVLTDEERFVVFKGFNTDDYTEFSASFEYKDGTCRRNLWLVSNDFRKVSDNIAQEIIKKVEEHYGGKLNLETLEIEQPKHEFKDGDIVTLKIPNLKKNIRIFKEVVNKKMHENHYYVGFNFDDDGRPIQIFKDYYAYTDNDRPATDSEKQQLFSALAKEGKRWNPDTKQIEDLPKKCEFKPMDWCLMRDVDEVEYRGFVTSEWVLCQFSHYLEGYKFVAVGGNWFGECIPYNEETAHLLGTTDEWKGGEQ